MSVKPILFNAEMVRGLLDNRKTVTRRVVKPQPQGRLVPEPPGGCWPGYFAEEGTPRVVRPPYLPGDILYVRETWCKYGELDAADQVIPETERYYYRADGENPTPFNCFLVQHPGWDEYRETPVWRPSIHMPREAARIFLRVTDVRVERLQDITAEQVLDEGVEVKFPDPKPSHLSLAYTEMRLKPAARKQFSDLWNSTIKKAALALYGWDANPWVWVIEFERISREEAMKHYV